MGITYESAGVHTDIAEKTLERFKTHLKTRPKNPNLLSGIGPFASCFSLKSALTHMTDPLLVTSCDGVGTKSMLALEWNALDGLGQDLVAMNVNDLLCVGALPLVFLDYFACGKLIEDQLLTLLKSIQGGCELAECALAGGETAEMPGLYQENDFDLGGFTVGVVDRAHVLGGSRIQTGDTLLAIESSGLHSNGYSLLRKVIQKYDIIPDGLCPFENTSWRDLFLKPTHIYIRAMKSVLNQVSGLAHITGEGIPGNLPRILPPHTQAELSSAACPLPPLFSWLQEKTALSREEMFQTFNCGIGMVAVVPTAQCAQVQSHVQNAGLRCWEIGQVTPSPEAEPSVQWKP